MSAYPFTHHVHIFFFLPGPVAWRTSVYDLRKRRTTQHRSPPAGAVCVSILNCLNFTGEGLTTFDGTMEGSNDLTEKVSIFPLYV